MYELCVVLTVACDARYFSRVLLAVFCRFFLTDDSLIWSAICIIHSFTFTRNVDDRTPYRVRILFLSGVSYHVARFSIGD